MSTRDSRRSQSANFFNPKVKHKEEEKQCLAIRKREEVTPTILMGKQTKI